MKPRTWTHDSHWVRNTMWFGVALVVAALVSSGNSSAQRAIEKDIDPLVELPLPIVTRDTRIRLSGSFTPEQPLVRSISDIRFEAGLRLMDQNGNLQIAEIQLTAVSSGGDRPMAISATIDLGQHIQDSQLRSASLFLDAFIPDKGHGGSAANKKSLGWFTAAVYVEEVSIIAGAGPGAFAPYVVQLAPQRDSIVEKEIDL